MYKQGITTISFPNGYGGFSHFAISTIKGRNGYNRVHRIYKGRRRVIRADHPYKVRGLRFKKNRSLHPPFGGYLISTKFKSINLGEHLT